MVGVREGYFVVPICAKDLACAHSEIYSTDAQRDANNTKNAALSRALVGCARAHPLTGFARKTVTNYMRNHPRSISSTLTWNNYRANLLLWHMQCTHAHTHASARIQIVCTRKLPRWRMFTRAIRARDDDDDGTLSAWQRKFCVRAHSTHHYERLFFYARACVCVRVVAAVVVATPASRPRTATAAQCAARVRNVS